MCVCQNCGKREALITVHPEGKQHLYDVCTRCAPRFISLERVRQIVDSMRPQLELMRIKSIEAAHEDFALSIQPKNMHGPRHPDLMGFGGGTGFTRLRKSERIRAYA